MTRGAGEGNSGPGGGDRGGSTAPRAASGLLEERWLDSDVTLAEMREAGYTLAGSVPHRSFGAEVVGEI